MAGELVGLKQTTDRLWDIYFGPIKLAQLDTNQYRLIHLSRRRKKHKEQRKDGHDTFKVYALGDSGLFVVLLTSGCSDPKETVIPPNVENWESDAQLKSAIEKLTDEEKKLVVAYVMRVKMGEVLGADGIKEGLTIAKAISLQGQWQDERQKEQERREVLAAELEEKRLAALREMNQALTVTLLSLEYKEKDYKANIYSDYFWIRIGFENNTANDIAGAKGMVVFSDIFGDAIKRIRLSNDNGIKANSNSVWVGTIDYNRFTAEDKKLRTIDFKKLEFDWEPEVYIFADGTRLTMPES